MYYSTLIVLMVLIDLLEFFISTVTTCFGIYASLSRLNPVQEALFVLAFCHRDALFLN